MYGLRKINKDGKNKYNDFTWPLEVGAVVEAFDWNPDPKCGGGLHCLPNAQGDYGLLNGYYWAVVEFDEADMVMIDSNKCKVKKCKIVYLSENHDNLFQYIDINKFDSEWAYKWAKDIRTSRDIMIDRVTDSYWAYMWALNIGNQDVMIDRITEPKWAFRWARNVGNKDVMINRITESKWAYTWALNIGNQDVMIDLVTESEWACYWALYIGDKDVMINRVTESEWAYYWALTIGNKDVMIQKFPELAAKLKRNNLCTA